MALCQVKTLTEKKSNLEAARAMIIEAAEAGAKVIMLPEMFVTPFQKEYMLDNAEPVKIDGFEDDSRCVTSKMLAKLARET